MTWSFLLKICVVIDSVDTLYFLYFAFHSEFLAQLFIICYERINNIIYCDEAKFDKFSALRVKMGNRFLLDRKGVTFFCDPRGLQIF